MVPPATKFGLASVDKPFAKFGISLGGIAIKGIAYPEKFDHIQSPFPLFDLSDKGLFSSKFIGKLLLRHSGIHSHFKKTF